MATPMYREPPTEPSGPTRWVEPGPLWAGGVATAVVAALIALAGVLITRWLFGMYVLSAAGAALVATALMHLLLLTTPRPQVFFGWIIVLATLVAVVFPFSTTAPLEQKLATAAVNLVLGIAIGTLTMQVAARAVRRRRASSGYQPNPPQSRTPGDQYR